MIIPWHMDYTEATPTRLRVPAREATDEAKLERAMPVCWHQGGGTVAARGLLAEPRTHGNESTCGQY